MSFSNEFPTHLAPPEEVQQLMAEHPALRAYILTLQQQVVLLQAQVNVLREEVKTLRDRLDLDSHNSHKPPSSDKGRPARSLRSSGDRLPGAQAGHKGKHLRFCAHPDQIRRHALLYCAHCGADVSNAPVEKVLRRQVYELPPLSLEVTEHQAEVKRCPCCQETLQAPFPDGVEQPTQYGERVKALLVYLNNYQLVPYQRIRELFYDLFGQPISGGLIYTCNAHAYTKLDESEQEIKAALSSSAVVHFDETGLYENGRRIWLHSASNAFYTYYHADEKRGKEAMDRAGILPGFKGIAVHDHFESYKRYERCDHVFCNAHHARELVSAYEQDHKDWAKEMKDLLYEIKEAVDKARQAGDSQLDARQLALFRDRYRAIIERARATYPDPPPKEKGQRGRQKQDKSKNLLDRLDRYEPETLRFMYDFRVPFDNNLAERDLRMIKVKQKISGTFRSKEGTAFFCRIRGVISTWKKQGQNILESLTQCFQPSPLSVPIANPAE